jgi:serine/threonine protein kinase
LTGRPAFPGSNIHEILTKNKKGEVQFPPKYWDRISVDAKDLVIQMLNKDSSTRIDAKEALSHKWFNADAEQADNPLPDVSENMAQI